MFLALVLTAALIGAPSSPPVVDPIPKGDYVLIERIDGRLRVFGPTSKIAVQVLIEEGGKGSIAKLESLEPPDNGVDGW